MPRNFYADADAATKTSSRDSPDIEFQEDWKKFVKDYLPRKFNRFEDIREGPGPELKKKVVEAIRKGDPFIVIDYIDGINYETIYEPEYDAYHLVLKEFSELWENPSDVREGMERESVFQDQFNEIFEEREENNWWDLLQGMEVLVWNTKDSVHTGWVGDPQDSYTEVKENPVLGEWAQKAIRFISNQQINDIVVNGFDYDVTMFIGGIYDAANVLLAMVEMPTGVPMRMHTGDVIVGAYDGLNGAGFFEHSSTNAHVENTFGDKNNPIYVDFGSYSLGDVFGTEEWVWK